MKSELTRRKGPHGKCIRTFDVGDKSLRSPAREKGLASDRIEPVEITMRNHVPFVHPLFVRPIGILNVGFNVVRLQVIVDGQKLEIPLLASIRRIMFKLWYCELWPSGIGRLRIGTDIVSQGAVGFTNVALLLNRGPTYGTRELFKLRVLQN